MSTDLIQLNTIIVNSFFGGVKRGQCLQFTPLSENYAQLERNEVVLLRDALDAWLDEPSELAALRARVGEQQKQAKIDVLNELLQEIDETVYVETWGYIEQKRDDLLAALAKGAK